MAGPQGLTWLSTTQPRLSRLYFVSICVLCFPLDPPGRNSWGSTLLSYPLIISKSIFPFSFSDTNIIGYASPPTILDGLTFSMHRIPFDPFSPSPSVLTVSLIFLRWTGLSPLSLSFCCHISSLDISTIFVYRVFVLSVQLTFLFCFRVIFWVYFVACTGCGVLQCFGDFLWDILRHLIPIASCLRLCLYVCGYKNIRMDLTI